MGFKGGQFHWVGVSAALVLGVSGLVFVSHPSLWDSFLARKDASLHVGTLTSVDGLVRHRPKRSFSWTDLSQRENRPVSAGERIYTSANGLAELALGDRAVKMRLLPNTLVVVPAAQSAEVGNTWFSSIFKKRESSTSANSASPGSPTGASFPAQLPVLDLRQGRLEIVMGEGDRGPATLALKAHDQVIVIDSSSTQKKEGSAPEKIQIDVPQAAAQGPVRLTLPNDSGAKVTPLSGGEKTAEIEILRKDAKEIAASGVVGQESRSPAAASPIPTPTPTPTPVPTPKSSPNKAMERSPKSEPVAKSTESPKRSGDFEVLPSLSAQSGKASTRMERQGSLDQISVVLRWTPVAGVKEYEVTLLKGDGTTIESKRVQVAEASFYVKVVENWNYRYQIKATLPSGVELRSQSIPIELALVAPIPKSPAEGKVIAQGAPILLTWERTLATQQYELEIAEDEDFRQLAARQTSKYNFFTFTPPKPGVYHWHVRGLSSSGTSEWSESRSFQVR